MDSRYGVLLVALILTLGQAVPAAGQGFVHASTTTGWTPIPSMRLEEEPTAREKEVRRIVEDVLNGRDMQPPM